MAKDYPKIAEGVLDYVGGADNIEHVMHCATRLRFTLKDIDYALNNKEQIKAISGVIDVIVQNGQYQVCIGPDVNKVFDIVMASLPETGVKQQESAGDEKKSFANRFFEVVSGTFTPIVPVLMASGMMGAVLTILKLCGLLQENTPTYADFYSIYGF